MYISINEECLFIFTTYIIFHVWTYLYKHSHLWTCRLFLNFFFFLSFVVVVVVIVVVIVVAISWAAPAAYGCSQARG